MTTISRPARRPATRRSAVGFLQAARMERIKLRTLRSPWVTLLITVAGVVGLATAVGLNSKDTHGDITSNVLAGVAPGLLAFGVLGVLVMTNEYSSGLIKATLAAVPHRGTLLAAKTAVFGAVALAVGETGSFAAFFAWHGGRSVGVAIGTREICSSPSSPASISFTMTWAKV